MSDTFICASPDELPEIGRKIIETYAGEKIFALYGSMGAGKTTFIKALCRFLGVPDIVNSPTFALVHEYISKDDESIFHFDFYRIKKSVEVMDIGFEEYIYSGYYCFMEWPEKIEELLPDDYVYIQIETMPDGSREISHGKISRH